MLLQTNSYIVPKEKRAEHARLLRRFRQALAKLGCDQFEVYEQVSANWGPEAGGRYVQIMRFRDRQHQLEVQAAERSDPTAQALIQEFCELINFPFQQQQGLFAVGFYTSILPIAPLREFQEPLDELEPAPAPPIATQVAPPPSTPELEPMEAAPAPPMPEAAELESEPNDLTVPEIESLAQTAQPAELAESVSVDDEVAVEEPAGWSAEAFSSQRIDVAPAEPPPEIEIQTEDIPAAESEQLGEGEMDEDAAMAALVEPADRTEPLDLAALEAAGALPEIDLENPDHGTLQPLDDDAAMEALAEPSGQDPRSMSELLAAVTPETNQNEPSSDAEIGEAPADPENPADAIGEFEVDEIDFTQLAALDLDGNHETAGSNGTPAPSTDSHENGGSVPHGELHERQRRNPPAAPQNHEEGSNGHGAPQVPNKSAPGADSNEAPDEFADLLENIEDWSPQSETDFFKK